MLIHDAVETHFRLQENQKKALKRLRITTIRDLLYHFPTRYEDLAEGRHVAELSKGETALVYGTLSKLKARKAWKSKMPMAEGVLTDESGSIPIMWFNQPYMARMLSEGMPVKVTGVVGERSGKPYFSNPEVEKVSSIPTALFGDSTDTDNGPSRFPVYPESKGITSRWFYHALQRVFGSGILETLEDPLPPEIRKRYNLPRLESALVWVHTPQDTQDSVTARKRFAFEEIFGIQLRKAQDRAKHDTHDAFRIEPQQKDINTFIGRFPFTPTKAQDRAVEEILDDLATPHAMSRLLEGDVGSGKTYVAAVTAHAVVTTPPKRVDGSRQDFGNLQVAYMAPTEILATQLFESFIEYFKDLPIQIGLITSSGCKKFPAKVTPNTWTTISRTQLLKWVKNGEIPILIGTHSLIQKTVEFKHLAYIIIDEQHRFGTMQRQKLAKKHDTLPHLLSMTATPIPRTLALTIYGDLDLTLLDQMPTGRKSVITEVVPLTGRDDVYTKIRRELKAGRQAYVICPRIDEPDPDKIGAVMAKAATTEAKRLQKDIFPEYTVGLVHSKLTPKKKAEVMDAFAAGDIDILTSTSVVEVGVNVPNATTIIIEGAERFGLAQLHQLRGRVLRSSHQAYCYLFSDTKAQKSMDRLKALADTTNGFELAERDLEFRGAGELSGRRQWGMSDLAMDAIQNIKLVEAARKEAQNIVKSDPELKKYPTLRDVVEQYGEIHFE